MHRTHIASKIGKWAEGYREHLYKDTVGKQTFGYGWNVDDRGCPWEIAEYAHRYFLEEAELQLAMNEKYFHSLDAVRAAAVIDMVYNLGWTKFQKFKKMRAALNRAVIASCIAEQDYEFEQAANEAMDSKWYRQVGRRGPVIVEMIRTGEWDASRFDAG